jgi:putative DNA methylase
MTRSRLAEPQQLEAKPAAPTGLRLVESDLFPFEWVSEVAELESWRKEVYRPIYHLHKWWAKRLGSVFRAMVLGAVLPEDKDLKEEFYRQHDLRRVKVFDPFMGSGTTVGEAHKLGCVALGRDINPVACQSVMVSLGPLDRDALLQAFAELSSGVGERLRRLYQTADAHGHVCDTLYCFWVKMVPCLHCGAAVDLFSSYVFARNACPDRKPEVRVCCRKCGDVFPANIHDVEVVCPRCGEQFHPHTGPATGASATCQSCQRAFPIAKAVQATGQPPAHRLFAKLVLTASGDKIYLPTTKDDEAAYQECSMELQRLRLPLPTLALADGHNTRQVLKYGYSQWRQFFNDRQLLALGLLHKGILELRNPSVRDAVLTVFSGTLEFNNMFASYKGEGTGAIRHMFAHHILKPERVPIEGNVWGTSRSSGSFSTLFHLRLHRALEYRSAPFEVAVERHNGSAVGRKVYHASPGFTGRVSCEWPPPDVSPPRAIYLSCGSSHATGLPAGSIDLVVTDPPFYDNVHYSELADFFYAWQQFRPSAFGSGQDTTRHPDEVQDVNARRFSDKLKTVFAECCRVLKKDGLLVFTYHHSRAEGWSSLGEAIVEAGFSIVNAHPVKAEMSVATPKSQAKEPIQLDVIMVCRKRAADDRERLEGGVAYAHALVRARRKACRLEAKSFKLSLNDRRVILISQFLVEACAGRSAQQLIDALEERSGELDVSAISLVGEFQGKAGTPRQSSGELEQRQLVLFDRPANDMRRGRQRKTKVAPSPHPAPASRNRRER